MRLNSFSFLLVFLPLVAIGFRLAVARGARVSRGYLALASLGFYAVSGLGNFLLLCGSIAANAALARKMAATEGPARKRLLVLGLTANIVLLSMFKYVNFALAPLTAVFPSIALPDWAFPLGISFFTLQQVMYLVDCYQKLVPPHGWLDHLLFVSFFPSIAAGPITRSRAMMPQLQAPGAGRVVAEDVSRGLCMLAIGVFKKSVLADTLGTLVDLGYSDPASISHAGAWVCGVGYMLQLYFDFSGYSDMAVGAARIFGIELPKNFDAPYRSTSVSEFWQRWHMTLSQFITTYLFTPLVRLRERITLHTSAIAMLVAMLIAGLWHGPSLNFVLFGLLHGVALAGAQYWKKAKLWKVPTPLAWMATMLFLVVTFTLFRVPGVANAAHVCRMLVPVGADGAGSLLTDVRASGIYTFAPIWLLALLVAVFARSSNDVLAKFRPTAAMASATVVMLLAGMLFMNSNLGRAFVYAAF